MSKYLRFISLVALLTLTVGCGQEPTSTPIPAITPTVAPPPSPSAPAASVNSLVIPPLLTAAPTSPTIAPPTVARVPSPGLTGPVATPSPVSSSAATVIVAPTPTQFAQTRLAQPTGANPTTVNTISPAISADQKTGPDEEEQSFLRLLNVYRTANGKSALGFEPLLYKSAAWLAQDMANKNYVSHSDSLGRDIFSRIKAFGYSGRWVGENIAGGFEGATQNLNIWQSDDIHKNNLLGANYTKAAAARYYSKTSFNRWYWVLDLG